MTTFYIVRHGETEWNAEERFQGWLDSPLSIKGQTQAKQLRDVLLEIPFVVALASTSGRAIETANLLLDGRDIELTCMDALREIYMGNWQGRTVSDILQSDERTAYRQYSEKPGCYNAVHTESFEQVTHRAMTVLQDLANRYLYGNVLVVTHGVTVKCIVNEVLGRKIADLWTPPWVEGTSVTELVVEDGQWRLGKIGCTAHLL